MKYRIFRGMNITGVDQEFIKMDDIVDFQSAHLVQVKRGVDINSSGTWMGTPSDATGKLIRANQTASITAVFTLDSKGNGLMRLKIKVPGVSDETAGEWEGEEAP
jgi:hypothetical protein